MKIDLNQYLKERYHEKGIRSSDPGPVITIARETGCPGKNVSRKLTDMLNQRLLALGKKEQWKWVGKEVFVEAAKELGLDPVDVQAIFEENRNVIDEILSSQSQKYYKNDRRVINTIGEVVRSMANDGHVIILGRGGTPLSRDIKRSLHIYLEAPLEWRVSVSFTKHGCTMEEARRYVNETDKRRAKFREHFEGKGNDYTWVDVKFNCMTLSIDEIASSIFNIMEIRNLIV